MPANRLYYQIKPYLPWGLRMAMRRFIARRKRKSCHGIWPIKENGGHPPPGWCGWPEGKKFALVLTHDVEGPAGLAKCRRLMELESALGFHSSYNFIPEGSYTVSRELREELTQNGFEVGVHDLKHDGRLYDSRHGFSDKARRINEYLREWGAAGFRSGFMLRQLDWLHDLNILYDASTFDTDPFEPQPGGVNTIFPFWVPVVRRGKLEPHPDLPLPTSNNGCRIANSLSGSSIVPNPQLSTTNQGFVELPYTLPQDSTLFLVLRERSPEIWLKKLDWIVQHGGMALVNVHPDYIGFNGEPESPRTFPSEYYIRLLKHIHDRYAGVYWQPLPREMAKFCSGFRPQRILVSRRRIGMVVHSVYQRDNRVIRYAEALAERGDSVEVIALKKHRSDPKAEKAGSVQLCYVQGRYAKNQKNQGDYLLPLLRFWAVATMKLTWRHFRHRYDLIHVHNMPDFLVFAAWFPKLTGAKIILDVHDIMPEFYASKFQKGDHSFGIRILKMLERASARFADHVIISNHLWLKPFVSRSAPEQKCSVFINYVNQSLFYRRPTAGNGSKCIIMFPGGLQWHQGLDIAIRAMPAVLRQIPSAEFHIHGDGNMKNELVALTRDLGLTDKVRFFEPRSVSEIAEVMSQADLAVVPKRADSFGNEAYSTKIMEFMSLGVPIVVSSTKIDRHYFNDSVARFFESGNPEALAEAIVEVLQNDGLRRRMITNAMEYADQNSWQRRQGDYMELVDALIEDRPVRSNKDTLDGLPTGAGNHEKSAPGVSAEIGQLAEK